MTNTLHRYGDSRTLQNDFIVFAIPCRGYNDKDCVPKLREFLRMAVRHNPVNIGDGSKGGMYRPSKELNPLAHWTRKDAPAIEEVVEKVSNPTTVAAVSSTAVSAVAVAASTAASTAFAASALAGAGRRPS